MKLVYTKLEREQHCNGRVTRPWGDIEERVTVLPGGELPIPQVIMITAPVPIKSLLSQPTEGTTNLYSYKTAGALKKSEKFLSDQDISTTPKSSVQPD